MTDLSNQRQAGENDMLQEADRTMKIKTQIQLVALMLSLSLLPAYSSAGSDLIPAQQNNSPINPGVIPPTKQQKPDWTAPTIAASSGILILVGALFAAAIIGVIAYGRKKQKKRDELKIKENGVEGRRWEEVRREQEAEKAKLEQEQIEDKRARTIEKQRQEDLGKKEAATDQEEHDKQFDYEKIQRETFEEELKKNREEKEGKKGYEDEQRRKQENQRQETEAANRRREETLKQKRKKNEEDANDFFSHGQKEKQDQKICPNPPSQETENYPKTREEAIKILGLDINPSEEEIKKAYRGIMQKYHPDTLQDTPDSMKNAIVDEIKKVNAANDILGR